MSIASRICIFALSVLACRVYAQAPPGEFEKVLVPVLFENPVPGAHGSLWQTTFWALNNSDQLVSIVDFEHGCRVTTCGPPPPSPPGIAFRPRLSAPQGVFMRIERLYANDVRFSLRVHDLSRQLQTRGTELPVVRENEFRSDRVDLIDIPNEPNFRLMLRVYDFDSEGRGHVRVRAYEIDPERRTPFESNRDRFVSEAILPFTYFPTHSFAPGYAQMSDPATALGLEGISRIRLEIEPVAPTTRVWAFMSITHNETQHVTLVTP